MIELNTRSLGGLGMTAGGYVCKRSFKLIVILRPPKDLAVLPCKDAAGLTAKSQENEIMNVKQPDPSEASG